MRGAKSVVLSGPFGVSFGLHGHFGHFRLTLSLIGLMEVYEGEWKDDKKHGNGTYKWATGTSYYEGEWKGDKRNGKGTYKRSD
ncbi:hypothetical protein ACHAWT_000009 [Skeletonema menzelii]